MICPQQEANNSKSAKNQQTFSSTKTDASSSDKIETAEVLTVRKSKIQDEHGPVAIKCVVNRKEVIGTFDEGSQVSIIHADLVNDLHHILNDYRELKDFGNHSIGAKFITNVPFKIGDSKTMLYPFFVAFNPPCKVLFGHDFKEKFKTITDEGKRCIFSEEFGTVPFCTKPQNLFHDYDHTFTRRCAQETVVVQSVEAENSQLASDPISPAQEKTNPVPAPQTEKSSSEDLNPDIDISKLKINPELDPTTRKELIDLILEYKHIFSWDSSKLGKTDRRLFEIDTQGHPPVSQRQYDHPEKIHDEIQKVVEDLLARGIVRKSESEWCSPCFFVPKKDDNGQITAKRFTLDYRSLNSKTRKIQWPIRRIDDIIQKQRGNKYFSVLDFASGYYQVPMSKDAQRKATFMTREGTFTFNVLPFGLCNGPSVFAMILSEVLAPLNDIKICIEDDENQVEQKDDTKHTNAAEEKSLGSPKKKRGNICDNYFDDIITGGRNPKECIAKLRIIFQRISDEGLTLKPYKCDFLQNQILILGEIVSANGVQPDPRKLAGLVKMEPPKTGKQTKKLVGFFSYFRRFVPKFAKIIAPIRELSTVRGPIKWTDSQQQAFNQIKQILLSRPCLKPFDPDKDVIIETDASKDGLGGALFQIHNGKPHPVSFVSRSLSKHEKNYPASTMLELTAVVWVLQRLRKLIYGSKITIKTDNHALCWLLKNSKKELNQRLSGMVMELAEYDVTIKHVSGKGHACADYLSRWPTAEFDPNFDKRPELPTVQVNTINMQTCQPDDEKIRKIINEVNTPRYRLNFCMQNGTLYHRSKAYNKLTLVIPKQLVKSVLEDCHDNPLCGHFGFAKTYERVRQRFWFPNMRRSVKMYVKSCLKCQQRKVPTKKPFGFLQPIPIPKQPFHHLQIDISGPYPLSNNQNQYIITAACYLSKFLETKAVRKADAETVAKFILEQIICRHGVPKIIQSDQGTVFTSELFRTLNNMLGIQQNFSTTYHPASQGQIERCHAVIHDFISLYMSDSMEYQKDWDLFLPHITFAINSSVHSTTKLTPFHILYGREPILPFENLTLSNEPQFTTLQKFLSHIQDARLLAFDHIQQSRHRMAFYHNKKRENQQFNIGDLVLCRKFYRKRGLSSKLMTKYFGPYTVKERVSDVNYLITYTYSSGKVLTEKVHVEKLKMFYPRDPITDSDQNSNNDSPSSQPLIDVNELPNEDDDLEIFDQPDSDHVAPKLDPVPPLDIDTSLTSQLDNVDPPELSQQVTRSHFTPTVPVNNPSVIIQPQVNQPAYNLRTRKQVNYRQ